ncbi:MAG: Crp/Fnr family transcriptional regulator [Elusimicrobia bacterium]|nr:Crp/Fnr family transcriptional regulator [Elusimicrobiota bacterium]
MEVIVPGQLFGMIAVMDDKPYPVSAVPLKPSEAYRIPAALFRSLLDGFPDFAKAVFASVGDHLRQAQALRALSGEPVERRVAHVLVVLEASMGKDLPIRREEVAELSGCTTPTAIRTLAAFRKKGWVASGWKRITVLKPAALRRLAEKP